MKTTQTPEAKSLQEAAEAPQASAPVKEPPSPAKKRALALKLPRKRKKWMRIAAVAVLAALGVYWFTHRGGQDPASALAGQYVPDTVQRRDLTVSVSGTGTVTPIDSYQVRSLVTGEMLEAPFEVGDQVEKGALLYRLDAGDAENAIRQAKSSVEQAQLNVGQARLAADQAQRGIELAKKNYDDYVRSLTVRASEEGVVQKVLVKKGDLVSAGAPIAEISDSATLTLTLPFHSADAQRISVGQSAQVTIAGTLETLPATVESVSVADMVGTGGTLVRQVKLRVDNPGALTSTNSATAQVGEIACAASGTFEENLRRTVTARASGQVTELPIDVGSQVSDGSVLAVLGGDTVRSSRDELDQAQRNARDAYDNAQIGLQNAQLSLENARLALQNAQDALENYSVTAPISGVVIEKNIKAGDKVDGIESGPLAVIYDLSYLKLEMNISELDLNKIEPGQQVEITADALPGQTFIGTVDRVSINGTTTNGFTTYPVTILLEDYGGLNPGMNVSADIVVERVKGAMSIPAAAVQRGDTVLVPLEGCLGEDGVTIVDPAKVEERTVTLGGSGGEYVEITSGLSEGDTVLVPAQAQDGMGGGVMAAAPAGG